MYLLFDGTKIQQIFKLCKFYANFFSKKLKNFYKPYDSGKSRTDRCLLKEDVLTYTLFFATPILYFFGTTGSRLFGILIIR